MFTLNDTQRARLAAIRAWRNEGERRFEFWSRREAQAAAAQAFGEALAESGLRLGRPLTQNSRVQLLRQAARLAPNGNLSRRLYAADPPAFDDRLRRLLLGTEPLAERLGQFLDVRGTGGQTASSLLCAFAPDTYPLITRPALRRLGLTAAQKREALAAAAERYEFSLSDPARPEPAHTLLALFVVYEQIRDALGLTAYPEVDEALRTEVPQAAMTTNGFLSLVRESEAAYDAPPPTLTEARLLADQEEYALGQGFTFPAHRLRAYYIALKTKPFVILSGVSGTGKTRLAELFAEALTGHHPAQFQLIPVRPDWNDSTALFGYHNPLANRYVSTPFLEIVRRAGLPENRQKAFFVCLDEMNLARVEHYLADYLSALESRAHRIPLHQDVPDLILPPNLFVTGTVNIDETTHGFSRKVLDRANTLDFDEAPELLRQAAAKGVMLSSEVGGNTAVQWQALFLSSRVANIGRARERLAQIAPSFPEDALQVLQTVNDALYSYRMHFAYRIRDDVLMFLANSFDAATGEGLLMPDLEANFRLGLDLQIVQKILPKLQGQSETLLPLLAVLQTFAEAEGLGYTAAKLARMQTHGLETGYVRFYE